MEWALLPFKRYATFSGRSRRKEFWLYILLIVIVSTVLKYIDALLGFGGARSFSGVSVGTGSGPLSAIFALAVFIPTLAVEVRRLHDTDRTGWWVLAPILVYIPLIAFLILSVTSGRPQVAGMAISGVALLVVGVVLLIFFCLPGTSGPNRFGDDPLERSPENLGDVFR